MSVLSRYLVPSLLLCSPVLAAQDPPVAASLAANVSIATPVAIGTPSAPGVTITAEQWAPPRSGRAVAAFPGLAALVAQLDRDPDRRLVLRFARSDEATLWAEELRAWLVALGLSSARIALEPGLHDAGRLLLELRPPR